MNNDSVDKSRGTWLDLLIESGFIVHFSLASGFFQRSRKRKLVLVRASARIREAPVARGLASDSLPGDKPRAYFSELASLEIGRKIASTIPPTTKPMTPIMIGSMSEVSDST